MTRRLLILFAMLTVLLTLPLASRQLQSDTRWWRDFGGGADSSHYVVGSAITRDNVAQLRLAWTYPTRDNTSYLFSPVVAGNMMYVLARNSALVALDATTGKEIWVHEGLQGIGGRGINYWESPDGQDRRLLFQIRNELQEIDARTGQSILTFGKNGYVDLREGLNRAPSAIVQVQSATPGKVFENLWLVPSATGESYMSPAGDLRAFDVKTGAVVWQFHTLPRPGEYGYETWPRDAWRYVGGVNTWGEISIDPARGIAYFPVGSGTYDFYGADRRGANLFADCILALDARTGRYRWHFQEVHHDLWDYDPVSAPQLLTIQHDGRAVDVVAHAGKTGFLYVLDRETGKPIWPIEERKVPASSMPGEQAWPTQPFPTVVPPFARQAFTVNDINPDLPAQDLLTMRRRVASAQNQGMFTPPATIDTVEMPGNRGGSNWGTTAAIPPRGLMYVLSIDAPSLLKMSLEQPGSSMGGIGDAGAFLSASTGSEVYRRRCQACHGSDRSGSNEAPSLVNITGRLGADVIGGTIRNGAGRMPPFADLSDAEISGLLDFLATGVPGIPASGAAVPSESLGGPVVATGGAPAGRDVPPPARNARIGLMDGPPYPDGVDAPRVRYFTGWNVLFDAVRGPWNMLTAYDLNSGSIKWKRPLESLRTEQRGLITTDTGLIFHATADAKIRAYDALTGDVLWTGDLPAGARGLSVMYQVSGRPYVAVIATQPIAGDAQRRPDRAYVTFTLPEAGAGK